MSYQLIRESHPIARKEHRCIWCGERIDKGSAYVHEISIFDGQLQNHHWHNECLADAGEVFRMYGPEFTAYENERPKQVAA